MSNTIATKVEKELDAERTIPWSEENFVRWRGYKLIAHVRDGRLMVHFPGGAVEPFSSLLGAVGPLYVRRPTA